ncbi:30S ribosomal protein S9 [Candidatus Kaiserbacteria bacterium RIFCSPLOWO2_02_FULL_56_11]|uniref:Small ribosomal subunit protein uS9 n=2 Tax=Candidatus Kaiseribacteriota TaxID=1752734 RepID=A0A1F6E478_9BACT|nr:MAG: 30S ribosomal protein S9 [Candidatus Kaiserbacteria bacterium RIFCSPHIGHO2_02_FULL_56_30]OGG72112.1 MAG: 30S ribosomal protein S9 [Candidatus Kaiserbacteria bacterium RIFCSPHIGHO2_12_FULL_56_13]OGG82074.1 MAG: 30S ribosomal protein S9 [Candidatus Kaiserbacteria bacterium RIFCSPLOWO2_02_FULL_56_11]
MPKNSDYITAVGRRKTSTASVRILAGKDDSIRINGKTPLEYFKTRDRVDVVEEALKKAESTNVYSVQANVSGGGISSQAGAVRHAIARALIKAEPGTRKTLKALGYLTRDPRAKERKKPGLKKARKAPQWSKR